MRLDQQIEIAKSQDAQLKSQVKAAEAAVRQATAERDQAADTLRRLEPLLPKGYATKEQVDQARTKVASLDAQVAQANEKLNQASVALSSLATLQAQRPGSGRQPWERRSWSYLIPGCMPRSMAKSSG